jgi:hypothetical protein
MACQSLEWVSFANRTAVLLNSCQQITVAALSAYLPTMMAEIGFKGANAQIATLAPYGAAVVVGRLLNQRQKL